MLRCVYTIIYMRTCCFAVFAEFCNSTHPRFVSRGNFGGILANYLARGHAECPPPPPFHFQNSVFTVRKRLAAPPPLSTLSTMFNVSVMPSNPEGGFSLGFNEFNPVLNKASVGEEERGWVGEVCGGSEWVEEVCGGSLMWPKMRLECNISS